jgi:HK97 family phage major capsid protein
MSGTLDSGLLVKKHAPQFLKSIDARSMDDAALYRMPWADLQKAKREARRTAGDLIDAVTDGVDERRAAELEACVDALGDFISGVDWEADQRTQLGSREPREHSGSAKMPKVEGRSAPAIDAGLTASDAPADEAFSLRADQSFKVYAQAKSPDAYRGLSLGKYLRAMTLGANSDLEHRALSEGTDSAGGYTVPTVLSAQLIDMLRADSVVMAAGAQSVPMARDNLSFAKVASDPVPAFRAEAAAIAESDPTFSQVTMTPKSLAVMVKVSRELLDDSVNIGTALPRIITKAMAVEMDKAALIGSGTGNEPTGIVNTAGIGTTALAGAPTYASLLAAQTGIASANAGPVSAFIMHPRDRGTLAGLVDTTGQPLNVPNALSGIPFLTTTALSITDGVGSDESTVICGNFANLMIGLRNDIRIEILKERYADTHQYGFVAVARFDVGVSHASAFHTITGVTA